MPARTLTSSNPLTVSGLVLLIAGMSLLGTGCGAQAGYQSAEHTVRLAARALTNVETHVGQTTPALASALAESRDWLSPSEAAIEMWSEGGDVAYERVAPCLGSSLGAVREQLLAQGQDIPASLEQAELEARGASERRCGE